MRSKTILVCDDDESILEILVLILTNYGFSVIPEKNSRNIFSLIERGKPDLVLLDLWMPLLNGDEVIKTLKSNEATNSIPVILISASIEAKNVAEETGADGFIAKPFQLQELMGLIENKLSLS